MNSLFSALARLMHGATESPVAHTLPEAVLPVTHVPHALPEVHPVGEGSVPHLLDATAPTEMSASGGAEWDTWPGAPDRARAAWHEWGEPGATSDDRWGHVAEELGSHALDVGREVASHATEDPESEGPDDPDDRHHPSNSSWGSFVDDDSDGRL